MDKLISILIPNFNKAPYLRETLDSIIAQTNPQWECIIVDDHSTDTSWEILEEYAEKDGRFKIYRRPEHLPKGGNVCRNYAFELSEGEYINWVDSDDIMMPTFLEAKLDLLVKHPDLDAVMCRFLNFREDINEAYYIDYYPKIGNILIDYVKLVHFNTAGPLFRKTFLREGRLFDTRLLYGQEKEYFYRLLLRNMKYLVLDDCLYYYRRSEPNDNSIVGKFDHIKHPRIKDRYMFFMTKSLVLSEHNRDEVKKMAHKLLFRLMKKYLRYFMIKEVIQTGALYFYSKFGLSVLNFNQGKSL